MKQTLHSTALKLTLGLITLGLLGNAGFAQNDSPFLSRSTSALSSQNFDRPIPLQLEQAFPFYVSEVSPGKLRVTWDIAADHYLYRHAFQFSMQQSPTESSLEVDSILPDGLKKTDQFFGDIEAYYGRTSVELSLSTVPGPDALLIIEYQGCADWGFCYPPQRAEFKISP